MKKFWIHCQTYSSFLIEAENEDKAIEKWQNGLWQDVSDGNYEIDEIEEIK